MEKLTSDKIKDLKRAFKKNVSYKFLREYIEIISNEDRFLILNLLSKRSCFLSDIEKELNKNQPSISHHVRILEKYKLIQSTKKGKFKEYSISRDKFVKLLNIWNQWFDVIRNLDY
jgi:predicted transcriptional regulator